MVTHALMSATADTAKALLHSARTSIGRYGDEVLPLASRSLGEATELLGSMTTREAQVAIGPAVNLASTGAARVGQLATMAKAGTLPAHGAFDEAIVAIQQLTSALGRRA